MSLYENWLKKAYTKDGRAEKKVWDQYVPLEQKIYEQILSEKLTEISGTVDELAQRFNMPPEYVCGFIDGISEATLEPVEVKELSHDGQVVLKLDFVKLYKKMVEYKAEHLYNLPEWDDIFSEEERKEMYWDQKKSGTVVKEQKVGRNEPCPCGSGKKYKKCCALVEGN